MSDTDIYKQREQAGLTKDDPRFRQGRRKRRSQSSRPFDDKERRRRSKNSGLRRLLHLSRKSENEKYFWWGLLIAIVVILAVVGIWQFWLLDVLARWDSGESGAYVPVSQEQSANLPAEESP